MVDALEHDTAAAPAPADPTQAPAPPISPAETLAKAIAAMNHPSNLSLQDKMHVMQNAINVMAVQLIPLLPTE
jgi:hypothetical protein